MADSTNEVIVVNSAGAAQVQAQAAPPAKRRAKPTLLNVLNGAYLAILAFITLFNSIGPEHFWGTTLNLYLPQWIWTLPGIPLWIATARFARRQVWMPTLGLLWVIGPIMGFCWSFSWSRPGPTDTRLRVLTYNVKLGHRDKAAILREVYADKPDIIFLQERGGILWNGLGSLLTGWSVVAKSQYVIASRYPIVASETRPLGRRSFANDCLRCQIQIGPTLVTAYSAHLLSPRSGLAAVRHHRFEGIENLQSGADFRTSQAQHLADYVRQEQGPVLVCGDLNAPVQSLVCKALFASGLSDAFSAAGRGYGYSYGRSTRLGVSYVRIDHILMSGQWRAESCWAGNEQGSDHRPVIADLTLPRTP